jgi:hypothetical protein
MLVNKTYELLNLISGCQQSSPFFYLDLLNDEKVNGRGEEETHVKGYYISFLFTSNDKDC